MNHHLKPQHYDSDNFYALDKITRGTDVPPVHIASYVKIGNVYLSNKYLHIPEPDQLGDT